MATHLYARAGPRFHALGPAPALTPYPAVLRMCIPDIQEILMIQEKQGPFIHDLSRRLLAS